MFIVFAVDIREYITMKKNTLWYHDKCIFISPCEIFLVASALLYIACVNVTQSPKAPLRNISAYA